MDLMRQLEQITEDDELEDWGYDIDARANSEPEEAPQIQEEDSYRTLDYTKRLQPAPYHANYDHEQNRYQTSSPSYNDINSITMDNTSQYEDSEEKSRRVKPSVSIGNTADTSNIYHFNTHSKNSCISTEVLSNKARSIFRFKNFNKMQSESFKPIYEEQNNCVISSPTGSGKTVLFELAILRLLKFSEDSNSLKILYIAPTKSLCLERERDWSSKFSSYGLSVGALTSDTSFLETEKVKRANIIITTPEKWDLVTRKWSDYSRLFKLIRLLLVDEIHILRDNRGSTLEVVITRMKKICENLRIIALSATVPNIQDVSGWVRLNSHSEQNAVTLVFGDEYRPVKLDKFVLGFKQTMNDFVFDSFLNSKLVEVLRVHSENKPVLIFCPTRNSTISTAKYLSKNLDLHLSSQGVQAPTREKELHELSAIGFSYHHAGLSLSDRLSVEKNFTNGSTKILCSTSTLAVGVNLPAYLVVIKGTKTWNGATFEEYSELDVLQMMGRAGRPQFETQGKAVLMTETERQTHYEKLVKGNEKLESRLHLNLLENIVPEIYLRTVRSVEGALEWLKLTFFYTRFRLNPTAYGEIPYSPGDNLDGRLLRYTESKLRELTDFKLIEVKNDEYQCTQFGNAMTQHYILFDIMKLFVRCSKGLSVSGIIDLVSNAAEFSNIRLKRTEKKLFKELNSSPILKFPLETNKTSNISSNHEKINLLIQFELGGLEYPNGQEMFKLQQSFKQDKFFVFKHAGRLTRCLVDCFLEKKDFISLLNCLKLSRSLNGKCWEDSSIVLRQLEGVGIAAVRRFSNQNVKSFDEVRNLSTSSIEYYLNQRPGFGARVLKDIENLPNLSVETHLVSSKMKQNSIFVGVRININCNMKSKSWHGKLVTVNIVSGLSSGELVDFRRAHLSKLHGARSFYFEFPVYYKNICLMSSITCEEIAGLTKTFDLKLQQVLPQNQLSGLNVYLDEKERGIFVPTGTDDDDLDELLVEATNTNKPTFNGRSGNEDNLETVGILTCKHTCKDKKKCRHFCCREGLAPKAIKRTQTKSDETDLGRNPKKVQKTEINATDKRSTNGSIKDFDPLNKLNLKASGKSGVQTGCILKSYKYYEPELYKRETREVSSNSSKSFGVESSEVDVIGLLREARANQSRVIQVSDEENLESSNSSVVMLQESALVPKNNTPSFEKGKLETKSWSDNLYHHNDNDQAENGAEIGRVGDTYGKESDKFGNTSRDHVQHFSQESVSNLSDILGSDVEVV